MTLGRNLLAGLGGAVALNILHEALKKTDNKMPRIDLIGEEALQKGIEMAGGEKIENENKLYVATLGADLLSNAVYFSAIGAGGTKYIWPKAIALGLTAGAGAVKLPSFVGLNSFPVTKSAETQTLTVAYYLFGALVTAAILTMSDDGK
ncbi:MAG TPA: hypothetical protein VFQ50_01470 [Flavobacterium sp.]|jgi:hypothetical protein|nr:hypothetical protein [Flavobacterium sp.]